MDFYDPEFADDHSYSYDEDSYDGSRYDKDSSDYYEDVCSNFNFVFKAAGCCCAWTTCIDLSMPV